MSPLARDSSRLAAAIERLDRLVDWERRDRGEMRPDLAPVTELLELLGNPQRRWAAVHVAGSKGKGSVASLIAAGLARCGLRVGCYASPHVDRVNERVRIQGSEVGDAPLAEALERALAAHEQAASQGGDAGRASWFDLVTAAAFQVFADENLNWAVVECGLGGRLDSTNVLDPAVCVITNVELEHTRVLGDTRAAIAAEKVGILRPATPLVTGVGDPAEPLEGDEAGAVLAAAAARLGAPVLRPIQPSRTLLPAPTIEQRNVALAAAVLEELGRQGIAGPTGSPSPQLLDLPTLAAARLPGRLELRQAKGVPIVIDGAHTPASVSAVLAELQAWPQLSGPAHAILGLGRDKDLEGVLKALSEHVDRVICTSVASGPSTSADDLARCAQRVGIEAQAVPDPKRALDLALSEVREGGWVLAIGSLYLAGAIRSALPDSTPGQ